MNKLTTFVLAALAAATVAVGALAFSAPSASAAVKPACFTVYYGHYHDIPVTICIGP